MFINFLNRIVYFFLNFKPRVLGYKNFIIAKNEILNIKKSNKKICLIYDLKTNPISIGNYCLMVFFARYLSIKGYQIYISIIESKKYKVSKKEIIEKKYIFKFFYKIPQILVKKNLIEVKFLSWNEALKNINDNKLYVFLKKIAYRRKLSPVVLINSILNNFALSDNKKFFENFLIDEKIFKNFTNKKIEIFKKEKYISILFRYDRHNPSRNTKKIEIIKIYNILNLKFPNIKILIISDYKGCIIAKNFLKNKKNVFFTSDFSLSIYSHIYMQLKSIICIASHNSGGMLTWHYFSKCKFCFVNYMGITVRLKYNHYYLKDKIHPWWNKKQIFKTTNNLDDLINLIKNFNLGF